MNRRICFSILTVRIYLKLAIETSSFKYFRTIRIEKHIFRFVFGRSFCPTICFWNLLTFKNTRWYIHNWNNNDKESFFFLVIHTYLPHYIYYRGVSYFEVLGYHHHSQWKTNSYSKYLKPNETKEYTNLTSWWWPGELLN